MASVDYRRDIEQLLAGSVPAEARASEQRDTTEQLTRQLGELARTAQEQAASLRENTLAVQTRAGAPAAGGSSVGSDVLHGAANFLLKGLTLGPVIGGLTKLFGGGDEAAPLPALERFTLPEPIRAEAGLSASGQMYAVDRGLGDQVRVLREPTPSFGETAGRMAREPQAAATNITVNVSAMDSRSFLDRSDEIARAVREAMLHSHALNDVVADL